MKLWRGAGHDWPAALETHDPVGIYYLLVQKLHDNKLPLAPLANTTFLEPDAVLARLRTGVVGAWWHKDCSRVNCNSIYMCARTLRDVDERC